MVTVLFSFCGCQAATPKHISKRLAHGGCAYSEVPCGWELWAVQCCCMEHTSLRASQGCGPRTNQQMESHYLDDQASLIWSSGSKLWRHWTGANGDIEAGRQLDQEKDGLFNAKINPRGVTLSIGQKPQYCLLYSQSLRAVDLEVDF